MPKQVSAPCIRPGQVTVTSPDIGYTSIWHEGTFS